MGQIPRATERISSFHISLISGTGLAQIWGQTKNLSTLAIARHDPPCHKTLIFTLVLCQTYITGLVLCRTGRVHSDIVHTLH